MKIQAGLPKVEIVEVAHTRLPSLQLHGNAVDIFPGMHLIQKSTEIFPRERRATQMSRKAGDHFSYLKNDFSIFPWELLSALRALCGDP